jgi:hypothetical protein
MAVNGTVAAAKKGISPAKDGAVAAVKDGWQCHCCICSKEVLLLLKMVLMLLLKMSGKGAVAAAKNAMLLLKRVLLQLPKLAGCGTAEASKKRHCYC